MASILVKINGNNVNYKDDFSENQKEAIQTKISELFGSDFFSIRVLRTGLLDTNLSTDQIPRSVYTISPDHLSFRSKIVQFRFKLNTETAEMTSLLNRPFLSND